MIFEQRTELYENKKKYGLYLACSLAFVAIGIWMLIEPPFRLSLFGLVSVRGTWAGILNIALFGAATFIFVRKLLRRLPLLVLDDRGITDYSRRASGLEVPWDLLCGADLFKVGRQSFLALQSHDGNAFVEAQSGHNGRRGMRMSFRMYGSPVVIAVSMLQCKPEELLAEICSRIPDAGEHGPNAPDSTSGNYSAP